MARFLALALAVAVSAVPPSDTAAEDGIKDGTTLAFSAVIANGVLQHGVPTRVWGSGASYEATVTVQAAGLGATITVSAGSNFHRLWLPFLSVIRFQKGGRSTKNPKRELMPGDKPTRLLC
jgi:hypothetical protein